MDFLWIKGRLVNGYCTIFTYLLLKKKISLRIHFSEGINHLFVTYFPLTPVLMSQLNDKTRMPNANVQVFLHTASHCWS